MSLKAFHIAFVLVCLVFFLFFAAWCFNDWRQSGSAMSLAFALISIVGAAVAVPYAKWFAHKLKDVGFL
jgi:hypothetical protein